MPPAGGARGRSVSFVGCGIGGVCVAARSAGEAVCCGAGRAGSNTGCVAAVPSCGGTEEGYCLAAAPTGDCPALPGVCTERGAVPPVSGGSCGPSGSKLFFFAPCRRASSVRALRAAGCSSRCEGWHPHRLSGLPHQTGIRFPAGRSGPCSVPAASPWLRAGERSPRPCTSAGRAGALPGRP